MSEAVSMGCSEALDRLSCSSKAAYAVRFTGDRMCANRFTGDRMCANRFTGDRICANRFKGDRICANRFTGDRMCANRFTGDRICANRETPENKEESKLDKADSCTTEEPRSNATVRKIMATVLRNFL